MVLEPHAMSEVEFDTYWHGRSKTKILIIINHLEFAVSRLFVCLLERLSLSLGPASPRLVAVLESALLC
jgi:hypothetical protein